MPKASAVFELSCLMLFDADDIYCLAVTIKVWAFSSEVSPVLLKLHWLLVFIKSYLFSWPLSSSHWLVLFSLLWVLCLCMHKRYCQITTMTVKNVKIKIFCFSCCKTFSYLWKTVSGQGCVYQCFSGNLKAITASHRTIGKDTSQVKWLYNLMRIIPEIYWDLLFLYWLPLIIVCTA